MIFAAVSICLWASYAVGIAIPVGRPIPLIPSPSEPKIQGQQISQSLFHQIIPEVHPFQDPTVCNGSPALCARPYDNVTYLGAHDSMAWSEKHLAWARDQLVPISTQLDSGARLLQAQAHFFEGELRFCHTSCHLFDGGLVVDYLVEVKQWLLSHPNEVLTLIFTNPERVSVVKEWMPLFEKAGLDGDVYFPGAIPKLLHNEATKINTWPLLGDMIRTGKRVVVFLDQFGLDEDYPALIQSEGPLHGNDGGPLHDNNGGPLHDNNGDLLHSQGHLSHIKDYLHDYLLHSNSDYPSVADEDHYPAFPLKYGGNGSGRLGFIFREWGRIWETPFSVTDPNFPCAIDRIGTIATHTAAHAKELAANKGRARGEAPTQMYMINHSLNWNLLGIKISNPDTAEDVNGVKSMRNHVNGCLPFSGQGTGSHRTSRHAVQKAHPTHQRTGFSLMEISGEQEWMLWPSSSHQRRAPGARNPTFMLLDWVNVGEGKRAVDEMNGIA